MSETANATLSKDPKDMSVEERFSGCDNELKVVLAKFGIGIVLGINYAPDGIKPKIDYFDQWALEAKAKEEAAKAAEGAAPAVQAGPDSLPTAAPAPAEEKVGDLKV